LTDREFRGKEAAFCSMLLLLRCLQSRPNKTPFLLPKFHAEIHVKLSKTPFLLPKFHAEIHVKLSTHGLHCTLSHDDDDDDDDGESSESRVVTGVTQVLPVLRRSFNRSEINPGRR
jgi:hypothetical protein